MTAFEIRRAGPGDLAEAARPYERAATETLSWDPPGTHSSAAFLKQAEDEAVWVAVVDDRIIGLAALYEPESFLHSLFIDAGWRGRGVGSALLAAVQAFAAGPLSLKVAGPNAAAQDFYAARGFHVSELGETDGAPWLRLVFRGI